MIAELQQGLVDLSYWCSKWQMRISVQKCSVLTVCHARFNRMYSVDNVCLPCVKSANDLGVHVDSTLRFSSQFSLR